MELSNWTEPYKEHLPLIATVLSAIFICVRIVAVADYDPETAFGILQFGGTGAVIFGSILSFAGPLAIFLTIGCAVGSGQLRSDEHGTAKSLAMAGAVVFFLISLVVSSVLDLFSSLLTVLVSLAFVGIVGVAGSGRIHERTQKRHDAIIARRDPDEMLAALAKSRRRVKHLEKISKVLHRVEPMLERAERTMRTVLAILMAIILAGAAFDPTPWLPAERLVIINSRPTTAYVLAESEGSLVILTAGARQIKFVNSDLIISRRPCMVSSDVGVIFQSMPEIFGKPRYIMC